MPSSKESRSPPSTFSAIGFSRESVMVNWLKSFSSRSYCNVPVEIAAFSNFPAVSNLPDRCRRAPEHQKRNTNIAVHREKRSVQLAQIVRLHQRMLVTQQQRHHKNPRPSRPRQAKTHRQPSQQSDHTDVH